MALDVWSEFKEQVRAQTNIVSLIGETRAVTPRGGGKEYVALCPFHDDHKPSMTINPERQTYRCWSCLEGGDCFSYLMKLENLDFRSALEQLAQRAGLELPRQSVRETGKPAQDRNQLLAALEWASEQFHKCLLEHPEAQVARDYLYDRGFCEEAWADFRLGFHPGPWEWLMTRARGQHSLETLEAVRLIKRRENGPGYSEYFRNRVIFPILNERKQVIAFGGRGLPGSEELNYGKYFNSSESALFSKSRQLYGIDHASQAMRDLKQVVVVEGYTDCIALHQKGLVNVVATLGTALTAQHVQLIRRFCNQVLLVFDGDRAGQDAAKKALPILLAQDIDLKLLALPEKLDPPEFLERYGLQEFQTLLQNATDAWEFKWQWLVEEHGLETTHGREHLIREMLELLAQSPGISGTPRENLLLNRLAGRVGLRGAQEQVLRQQLQKIRENGARIATTASRNHFPAQEPAGSSATTGKPDLQYREEVNQLLQGTLSRVQTLERDLLEIVIIRPDSLPLLEQRSTFRLITHRILRRMLELCQQLQQRQEFSGADSLLTQLEDPELKKLILGLTDRGEDRRVKEKLQDQTEFPAGMVCPVYLKQVIEQLEWEHKETLHRKSTQLDVVNTNGPATVDDRLRQLLQDAAQFHQQRVTRKTASN